VAAKLTGYLNAFVVFLFVVVVIARGALSPRGNPETQMSLKQLQQNKNNDNNKNNI
jgi:hypothetical protein